MQCRNGLKQLSDWNGSTVFNTMHIRMFNMYGKFLYRNNQNVGLIFKRGEWCGDDVTCMLHVLINKSGYARIETTRATNSQFIGGKYIVITVMAHSCKMYGMLSYFNYILFTVKAQRYIKYSYFHPLSKIL